MNISKTNRLHNPKVRVILVSMVALLLITSFVIFEILRGPNTLDSNDSELPTAPHTAADSNTPSNTTSADPSRKTYYAWFEADQSTIERHEEIPTEAVYVKLHGEFDKWLIGSPVIVEIPQTKELYRTVVDRMEIDDFGNQRIWAEPDDDEEEFSQLILTVSDSETFAYVSTHDGNFELIGTSDGGWLVPTNVLQAKIDTTKKDVLGRLRDRHTNTKYVPKRSN